MHERVHAIRQDEMGILWYLLRYNTSVDFKRKEEKLAYYVGIKYYISQGQEVDIDYVATALSSDLYWNMMTYNEAKEWVEDIVSGEYNPPINPKYLIPEVLNKK